MLVAERHQKIAELVNERKSIRVSELSQLFSVTEETIRRDLEKLERENKLERSHGGAVSLNSQQEATETSYKEREIKNVTEKRSIAAESVKHVNEGDKIILDASSTAWYMAKILPDIPLTVLTNSIKVALELSLKSNITVISTGGILTSRSLSYVGPLAEESLNTYHVHKAFISCQGFDLGYGISESNEEQGRIKKKICDISDSIYVMVDHTKFGVRSFSHIHPLDKLNYVITDQTVSSETLQLLRENNIRVVTV
ncbi:DNA-binding transcriptional regulator of sugar metabolism, DeoR/GlpR family [Salinibacillus kushneri]|uniref:DNA-binding transcriptional regulator of sugar metabolism, DeoR/GlpR family n=1 Tax=Salinibacillus kushneri TaxID=237682 RepID=A0A1H9Z0F3_9BACI|nr:DeoR/GlpR family DNA-binding transcription regulator [Salinibacillus kushneri]SES74972.1 DNA-binding transcriptional regulator of sugar metabolism, DeoR/GlpR family [Salinibacillus kushneri]